ncbi:exo-alpha-sialidase [Microbacterium luticocti]|uniref:exo-alpha-sialidase n=1 Tax=Microbacterium luticocti TaxID=451764 RepID=UPI000684CEFE|nr:exo-alpha-sialidase [Microbacterium luticocti]
MTSRRPATSRPSAIRRPSAVRRPSAKALLGGLIGVALVLGGVTAASAAPLPPYVDDPTQPPGTFTTTNIASDRTAKNFYYRIPAVASVGDGVVVAVWDGRPNSAGDAPNPNSIMMRRSTDNGQTWGPVREIAAGQVASAQHGYSDPSIVVDHDTGHVFVFSLYSKNQGFFGSVYGNDDADRNVMSAAVTESPDGGVTWKAPRLITADVKPANGSVVDGTYVPVAGDVKGAFATSGDGTQLRYGEHAGRLIQQYAGIVRQADGSEPIQAYSVYSDDHGATWQMGTPVGDLMDENKVVELSDGKVMLNSRDHGNGHRRKVAVSDDGGQTYGPVTRDPALLEPTNNAAIIRLHPDAAENSADAKKLLFINSNSTSGRVDGAVRVSCDDGKTWPGVRQINKGGTFGYASATVLDDGDIGVLWEKDYVSNLQFTTFDEAWMKYVCAPLTLGSATVHGTTPTSIPVTVTNQEQTPLSGEVTFFTPDGWSAQPASVQNLAPGASTTVDVTLTAPATAGDATGMTMAFTASDGRVSQSQITMHATNPVNLGATLAVTNTSPARDVATDPYRVGDTLTFTVRVTSSSNVATVVEPTDANFTDGFAPTKCRYGNLPAKGAYNCAYPTRTLTQQDIDRGWFQPRFGFTIAPTTAPQNTVPVSLTGSPVLLSDQALSAVVTGERGDAARDLATDPYAVGDQVPYTFHVENTSPVTTLVAPTAGNFAPFVPPGPGNCRYSALAGFASYDCAFPRHTVTQDELDQGFFVPQSTWSLSAAGQAAKTLTVTGDEVDVRVRDPHLSATVTGTWHDVDGNGVATTGDTVTWTSTLGNDGNVRLDQVAAGGAAVASLAPGVHQAVATDTVTLTAADVAAGSVAGPALHGTAHNGARTVSADAAAAALTLKTAPAWDAVTTYDDGDLVGYAGSLWSAMWWTKNQKPGDPWGPWQEIATTATGEALWTPSRVFDAGDVVSYHGTRYAAKWWTRNQAPGDPYGPWQPQG